MKNEKLKIVFSLSIFCILHFAFFINVNAQNQLPPPAAPKVVALPKPVEKTLPNGLRVIVAQTKNVPIVTAQLLVKSGGESDPKNLSGLADFTASLLTKGTKTRSATQIAEEIEFLGGSIGAGAGWDSSNVSVRVTNDKTEKALAVLADVVMNPAFQQEEIDRYREQLLDGLLVQMKQPGTIASNVANILAFGAGSKYAHPLGGTPESVQRIKQGDLVNFHQQHFLSDNAVLVFTGDILPSQAFLLANKYFAKMKKSKPQGGSGMGSGAGMPQPGDGQLRRIVVVNLPNSGQAAVNYIQPSIERNDENYYNANVLNSILGGGYSSRLNQEVRIKRGLSYGAGSSFGMRRAAGVFRITTQTKNESAAEVAELFVQELNKIGTNDISENELTPRKSTLTGDFGRGVATTNGLAGTIGSLAVMNLPLSSINSYIQKINSVSATEVKTFAKNNLTADRGVVVIVGDSAKFMDDLKKRFPKTEIRVIQADKLDLESDTLEKK
jgi:zinc protease